MRKLLFALVLLVPFFGTGCTFGKVVATPLTAVRDTVDVPLVTLTNVFELWADQTDPFHAPSPYVGWSYRGGLNAGVAYGVGWFVFKPLSGIFGGVDYVVCRSLYPKWPEGITPWRGKDSWGSLYFPNTRALWGDDPPDTKWEKAGNRERGPGNGDPP